MNLHRKYKLAWVINSLSLERILLRIPGQGVQRTLFRDVPVCTMCFPVPSLWFSWTAFNAASQKLKMQQMCQELWGSDAPSRFDAAGRIQWSFRSDLSRVGAVGSRVGSRRLWFVLVGTLRALCAPGKQLGVPRWWVGAEVAAQPLPSSPCRLRVFQGAAGKLVCCLRC